MAIALGAGLAFGFGGQEYVEQNISRWMRCGKSKMSSDESSSSGSSSSGSCDPDDRSGTGPN